ncbi:amine oxidase [Cryptococcus bacillisporus CA1873]|uniref:Amine oxidase n=1 Tax=Cryptococcus bacillisporus CA1873 TaxID=1296111 RepID=A0ABR5BB18_CRYGA|nr:amine oxidase [Cryptococcus bacillisporus CA1873]|eukprot:KIR62576.1 amine oxidase [Cryptococcus gattii CA1873]
MGEKLRVAIVGGGVGGLSALWVLHNFSQNEVHIYEKEDWWGGHAHTVGFQRECLFYINRELLFIPPRDHVEPGKEKCDIDTAFIAINSKNYPNFYRFLLDHSVELIKTTMSFSLSRDHGAFEWASNDLWSLFCQSSNFFRPRVYRMMWDIFRFHVFAKDLLSEEGESEQLSIGEYLDREGYSQSFKEDYLLPLTAGIWSIPPEKVALDFPAMALIRFFHNHQMLQLWGKPSWLTVKGGSNKYVEKIIEQIPKEELHLGEGVRAVIPQADGSFIVREVSGKEERYDKVILATHTDQSVSLLGENITPEEKAVLGGCDWSANEAVVHYDEELGTILPLRNRFHLATSPRRVPPPSTPSPCSPISFLFGCIKDAMADPFPCAQCSTFDLNVLQSLPVSKHGHIFVTLNPPIPPSPSKTLSRWIYHHPTLTPALLRAQQQLPSIQGVRGLYFVGAWTGYGFHEDGWRAGMEVAYRPEFGVPLHKRPWDVRRVNGRDVKREMGEWALRPIIGTLDWGVKGLVAWASWTLGLYMSSIRVVGGQVIKAKKKVA